MAAMEDNSTYSNIPPDAPFSQWQKRTSPAVLSVVLALPVLFVLLKRLLFPTFDPREPPVLRPRVPFIGHVIALVSERSSWYRRLYAESPLPICTLPMLHGKMYVINSPELITAAMKNIDISFDPFLIEFSVPLLSLNDKIVKIIEKPVIMQSLMRIIHTSLMGEPLAQLNVAALAKIMETFNNIQPESQLVISDIYTWLWNVTGDATMRALFGEKNPITSQNVQLLATFEKGVSRLLLGFAPWLLAPGPFAARRKLHQLLLPFYEAGHDKRPDVSMIIRERAAILRQGGFNNQDLMVQEVTIPWVAVTNTIPTLFWFFMHIFSNPDRVERIRREVEAITTITTSDQGRQATIVIKDLEKKCNYLLACYRETLRITIHNVGSRRVLEDTTIKDGEGREYLLEKGINVQWCSSLTHVLEPVWGDDASSFVPERFLDIAPRDEKRRRGANIPFGGGRNLCPGRNFALAENIGFVGVLCAGFNVEEVQVPGFEDPVIGTGSRKPVWGDQRRGTGIGRRKGWEDVTWTFI